MKCSKKGSAIVEATLIVPVIISVVIAILYIVMALYSAVEENCLMHRGLLTVEEERLEIGDFIRKVDFMKGLL